VVVDIGTGDGRYVYRSARSDPDRIYIGIDVERRALQKISEKILSGSKSQIQLRRRPLVLVDESPEHIPASDLPVEDLPRVESRFGRFKVEAPGAVWPGCSARYTRGGRAPSDAARR
jgi:hypothetical protein